MGDSVDELEQYSCRNCLLLHRIQELEDKNTNVVMKTVEEEMDIVYKKKKLKGKSFLITESLTAKRVGLSKEVQGKYGVSNVWTTDGCILYKENRVFLYKNKFIEWL